MRLFLDTGPLLAAVLPKDPDHAEAVALFERIGEGEWSSVHTSDFIVAEALNFVRMKVKRVETADALLGLVFGAEGLPPPVNDVLRVHAGRLAQAIDLYRAKFDRGLSLTDWTSIVLAKEEEIDAIATFDSGFKGLLRVVPSSRTRARRCLPGRTRARTWPR